MHRVSAHRAAAPTAPSPSVEPPSEGTRLFAGGGEIGAVLSGIEWANTPLGPVETWPQTLRTSLRICLSSRHAIIIWWGPEFNVFYNDAYSPTLGIKHPWAAGRPGHEVWSEIWDVIGPMLESVRTTGEPTWSDDQLLFLERSGYPEETYHTFSYSPIEDESGHVAGVFTAVTETTQRVLSQRRTRLARDLATALLNAHSTEEVCARAALTLASDPEDIPFALLYGVDRGGLEARLLQSIGLASDTALSPLRVALEGGAAGAALRADPWSLASVIGSGDEIVLRDIDLRGVPLHVQSDLTPRDALVLPIIQPGQTTPSALLVAGVSPRRQLDDDYAAFYALLANHLATTLASARAYDEERARAEALAELDRAKTTFFSNISHEFRTPLTLLLGPLEELLADPQGPDGVRRDHIETAHRNAQRLLRLVNSLLDFSRIEAGRIRATYAPTDLASYTTDLASVFRSAIERAGLRLVVDCAPLPEPTYVDREMWERIVLNLLSNALKFTFEGTITVTLRAEGETVALVVRDTGIGIPPAELPRLFERFHRVEGARGRSFEGSGIGLAMVRELAELHGGAVQVESIAAVGSAFTVHIPLGDAHLPSERIRRESTDAAVPRAAAQVLEEALQWLPETPFAHDGMLPEEAPGADGATRPQSAQSAQSAKGRARVLIADDNMDMRGYLRRLLRHRYVVQTVSNGAEALKAIDRHMPDLVLSDVMMPEVDGFALLAALRSDPRTSTLPVILLSARAGEEATLEGLAAGAADYLVKPFSAGELFARVEARLEIARARKEILDRAQQLEAIFEAVADGLVIYDATGRLTQWNAALAELFEFERDPDYSQFAVEVRPGGLRVRDEHDELIPTDQLPFMRALRGETLTGTRAVDLTVSLPSGRVANVSASAAPLRDDTRRATGSVVVYRDVTERKRLERQTRDALEALIGLTQDLVQPPRRAEARTNESMLEIGARLARLVQRVFGSDRVTMSTHDPTTGSMQPVAAVGLDPSMEQQWWRDVARTPLHEYLAPETLAQLSALHPAEIDFEVDPLRNGTDDRVAHMLVVPLTLGETVVGLMSVEHRSAPRVYSSDDKALMMAIGRLSALALEHERLTREREDARTQALALAESNRRMDEFLSVVSHELKTPLTSMKAFAQVALRRLARGDPPDAKQLIQLDQGTDRMDRLVNDLLDAARLDADKLLLEIGTCDLRAICERVAEEQMTATNRRVILDLPTTPVEVEADPSRVAQVINNLLSNALKYSPTESPVALTLRGEQEGRRRKAQPARVTVRDRGPGIAGEAQRHIFDRFYRVPEVAVLHGTSVGLGLGLYLCCSLVSRMGGEIGVVSRLGDGSMFWFTLPLAQRMSDR